MENQKIARIFKEIGDVLELQGENRFRVLAYQRAAQTIDSLNADVRTLYDETREKTAEGKAKVFEQIPGIGKDLASKIVEILETGKCRMHQQLLAGFDKGLLELLTVRGLGPKKVRKFFEALGVDNVAKLKAAAEKGEIAKLPGMGEKSQTEILKALEEHAKHRERIILHAAVLMAEEMVAYMKRCPMVKHCEYAGSCRRGKETIGDLDILATGSDHAKIIDYFVKHREVTTVLAQGDTKASVLLEEGVQVDLRVVDDAHFGAALQYFTGSKEHNVHMRKIAISKGLKVSEYGVFRTRRQKSENRSQEGEGKQGGKEPRQGGLVASKTEEEVYKALGLPYFIPEIRRDEGEIEAGLKGKLPKSIELQDIRGDLHVHTTYSDGEHSLEAMVMAAMELGYEYVAISDHSPAVRVANGMNEKRLLEYIKVIEALNEKLKRSGKAVRGGKPFVILKSSEVDILEDGSLDYPDELLKRLDLVNISVHRKFNLLAAVQTARIVKALSNPYVTILSHPTGQIVKQREPYAVDLVAVARAAAKYRVALEVNGSHRLDLGPGNIRLAKEQGAKFVVNTDSHQKNHLTFMRFGVMLARGGWLEAKDVLNTLPVERMMGYWRKRK